MSVESATELSSFDRHPFDSPLLDPELRSLLQKAEECPRRYRAVQKLLEACEVAPHPFIRSLRAEDLRQRLVNPSPLDNLLDRLDLIRNKLIRIIDEHLQM